MKILVTGATGFIGQSLVCSLSLSSNLIIASVRSLFPNFPDNVKQVIFTDLTNLNEELFGLKADSIDVVIHLAARAHIVNDQSRTPILEFRKVNRDTSLKLAGIAAKLGVKRFVFLSSIGVNGHNNQRPFTEKNLAAPQEPYAVSKYEAEEGLLKIAKETGMEIVIIRPPLVYGPNAPGNFGTLVRWMQKGIPLPFGAIHNKRSLIALENLVDFIALCADREKSPKAANQVFLISDGEDVSTTQLLKKVSKAFNKKAMLLPIPVGLMTFIAKLLGKGDVANRLFGSLQVDSSKARDLLGWKPVTSMDEQLKKTAQAYLSEKK